MDGGVPLRASLDLRTARIKDLAPAMRVIADEANRITAKAFATETAPDGTPWAKHAKSTQRARERQLQPDSRGKKRDRGGRYSAGKLPILDATGKLKRAAMKFRVSMVGVQWVIPRYGRAHAKGTPRMPKREFSPFEPRPNGGWAMSPAFAAFSLDVIARHTRGEPIP